MIPARALLICQEGTKCYNRQTLHRAVPNAKTEQYVNQKFTNVAVHHIKSSHYMLQWLSTLTVHQTATRL